MRNHIDVLLAGQNFWVAGGSDRYLIDMADCLDSEGLSVGVFAGDDQRNLQTEWSRFFPPSIDLKNPRIRDAAAFVYSRKARLALKRMCDEVSTSLVHLNIYYGKLTSSIFKPLRERGIPVVQTLHEYKLICPVYTLISNGRICGRCNVGSYASSFTNRCNRGSIARSFMSALESYASIALGAVEAVDHFVAISDFSRNKHIEHGVPASKITTVHNFVKLEGVLPSSSVGEYVLFFGRIERIKGVFTLLEAAMMLPEVKFVVIGAGSAEQEFAEEVKRRGCANVELRAHLRGSELDEAIRGSLCTVLPSEWLEPFGLTILESFARGRCVVASRIGGIPEIISHGEDGLLFSPGDAAELAAHLRWLTRNPVVAAKMGASGRRKVEESFTWSSYFKKLKPIYAGLGVSFKS